MTRIDEYKEFKCIYPDCGSGTTNKLLLASIEEIKEGHKAILTTLSDIKVINSTLLFVQEDIKELKKNNKETFDVIFERLRENEANVFTKKDITIGATIFGFILSIINFIIFNVVK